MKLPVIFGKKNNQNSFKKKGYYVKDQKGSYIHLKHSYLHPVTIPNHKIIAKGILREIIKASNLEAKDLE